MSKLNPSFLILVVVIIAITFLMISQPQSALEPRAVLLTPTPSQTPLRGFLPFTANNSDLTPTATSTPSPTAPTPTGTLTATPTPEPTTEPTSTPPGNVTQVGELGPFVLRTNSVPANQIHSWTVPVELQMGATAVLTATAFSADDVDLVLAIADEQGHILTMQNNMPANEPERLSDFVVSDQTTYQLYILTADGTPANYATTLMYETSIEFVFQEVLTNSLPVSQTLSANKEHFWFYEGTASETVVIEAIPDANTDVFIELYDPDADRISPAFINSGANGVTEIYTRELPVNGVYIIRIGEWNFIEGRYTIQITEGFNE